MAFAWYQARWRQFPLGPYPPTCESYMYFLGYATIIGAFVKTLLKLVAKPLTNLTWKSVEFIWDVACIEAFSAMKKLLTTALVL